MKSLLFVLYLVIEIAAFVALGQWLGYLTAILIAIAATAIGVLMLRRTAGGVLRGVAEALDGKRSAGPAMVDSAVLALGIALLAVPGLVSTVAGMVLISRPGRAVARPVVAAFGARKIASLVDESQLITVMSRPGFGTVVEGQVVDGGPADGTAGGPVTGTVDGTVDRGSGPRPGPRPYPELPRESDR